MEIGYFADTYALIEIIKGNKNYQRFLNKSLFTSIFNLYELYYSLLRDYNEIQAKQFFFYFKKNLIKYSDNSIFSASKFKLDKHKRGISYTDALGYSIASENNLKFLTGDKEFKGLNNVEFVK
ncbi:MAG: PIN domain-containing protein [Nanoarchaeota archaeon]